MCTEKQLTPEMSIVYVLPTYPTLDMLLQVFILYEYGNEQQRRGSVYICELDETYVSLEHEYVIEITEDNSEQGTKSRSFQLARQLEVEHEPGIVFWLRVLYGKAWREKYAYDFFMHLFQARIMQYRSTCHEIRWNDIIHQTLMDIRSIAITENERRMSS